MRFWAGATLFAIAVFFVVPTALGDQGSALIRYDGYQVVRTYPASQAEVQLLRSLGMRLISDAEGVGVVDYLVPPQAIARLAASGVRYDVLHEDAQRLIDEDRARLAAAPHALPGERGWFDNYKRYAEINAYLDWLASTYPNLVSPKYQIGTSWEGRPIYAITVTSPVGGPNKPAMCFDGACHARERITPMTVMYVTDRLVQTYSTDPDARDMLDKMKFYIVPVINPDGYEYHWDYDSWWRKTRRNNGNGSYGVDWNRNASVGWGGEGASHNPWDETYCGTGPFSEPETQATRNFILSHPDIVAYVNFHSYGQLLLRPYGYAYINPPEPDFSTFKSIGTNMATAIYQVHGKSYTSQAAYDLYLCSGVITDWAYQEAGLFAWAIELRDTGEYGFFLPPSQIIPTGQEIFAAVKVLANYFSRLLQFSFPNGLPSTLEAGQPTPVTLTIQEISGDLNPNSPTLYYRTGDSGPFSASALAFLGGTQWQATLPATACGKQLQYYFLARTTDGTAVTSPDDAPATFYAADALMLEIVVQDYMETDLGWTVGAPGDDATTGIWDRADPQGTTSGGSQVQPEDDHTPNGTKCWVTDSRAGGSAGAYDVDGGKTTLTSPAYDLSGAQDARIGYWRWYSNHAGGAPHADVFEVFITNNGTNWVNVETVGPSGAETEGGWYYHEFLVSDFVAPTANVRLRFVASDYGSGSLVEAAVDDLTVVAVLDCPYALGDLNCDTQVDGFDIQPFVLALTDPDGYASQYPDCDRTLADCNEDGTIDGFDIQPFVNLLVGG